MSTRLAVVGAGGWLGRAVVRAAADHGWDVTAVVRQLPTGPGRSPSERSTASTRTGAFRLVTVDHQDPAALVAALQDADVVVNAAGCTVVGDGDEDLNRATEANHLLPTRLAELASVAGWRLVHLGSAAEYGPDAAGTDLITEDHPAAPTSAYGRSKLAGTTAVLDHRAAGRTTDPARAVVARVFNVVDHDLPTHNPLHGVAEQVRRAATQPPTDQPVVAIGDPDTTRDVASRTWVAEAIVALAGTERPWPAVVNVCTGHGTSFGQLASAMGRQVGCPTAVHDLGWPRGGRIVGDPARLAALVELPLVESTEALARSILGILSDSPAGHRPPPASMAGAATAPSAEPAGDSP